MRRLPVIQNTPSEDAAAEARPAWQWWVIGAGLTATLWLPLATLAAPLGATLAARLLGVTPGDVASGRVELPAVDTVLLASLSALPLIVCFGVAALAAGAMVGRFGPVTGRRDAGISAVLAALLVTLLAAFGGAGLSASGLAAAAVTLGVVGVGGSVIGAAFGARKRRVLGSPR